MEGAKPYILAVTVRVIVAGMFVINKAAMDHGLNSFVFVFYRQIAASLLLLPSAVLLERRNARSMSSALLFKIFLCALIGITVSGNLYNVSLKLTSATVVAASSNSLPVITFCLALILRMEEVKLRSSSGVAKLTGVAFCLAGVLVIALYSGKLLSPVNHHRAARLWGAVWMGLKKILLRIGKMIGRWLPLFKEEASRRLEEFMKFLEDRASLAPQLQWTPEGISSLSGLAPLGVRPSSTSEAEVRDIDPGGALSHA